MINTALTQYGVNKYWIDRLEEIFVFAGVPSYNRGVNWCGIFMGYCAKKNNLPYPDKYMTARSWLTVGEPVDKPNIGDVVVFWRESETSWKGHVGLFIGEYEKPDNINILGGNQSSRRSVTITKFPTYRVLGYRRLQHV